MFAFLSSLLLLMASTTAPNPNPSNIRVIPVRDTPEPTTAMLRIVLPEENEVVSTPVYIQFRIDGFSLGAASQFERADELVDSNLGQSIHVIIDDQPYFPVVEPSVDPFDESGYYYNMSYKFKVPYRLDSGIHTVRMFPARSFGEGLKGDQVFVASQFFVGSKKTNRDMNLRDPYITYNEPSQLLPLSESKPVLLDFYVSNTELSKDGYKVRLSIDGKVHSTLTSWQPYYIYGLKKGKHQIRLELLNNKNNLVSGDFNDVSQSIYIN